MKLTENFSLEEFACKDAKKTPVPARYMENVTKLAENLQVLRDALGVPIHINSGYRTPEHNTAEGGMPLSQHLTASAADIWCKEYTPKQVKEAIEKLIAKGKMHNGGIGLYPTFVHYDIRRTATRW
jgi:uncharacterized protein YcbK (DUF882 family)